MKPAKDLREFAAGLDGMTGGPKRIPGPPLRSRMAAWRSRARVTGIRWGNALGAFAGTAAFWGPRAAMAVLVAVLWGAALGGAWWALAAAWGFPGREVIPVWELTWPQAATIIGVALAWAWASRGEAEH